MRSLFLFFLALLAPAGGDPHWTPPAALDQGTAPQCVAYALLGWAESAPGARPAWTLPAPAWLYARAQARDGLPLPHAGTFVGAGWDVLAAAGLIAPGSARFTADRPTGAGWLTRGPVVMESDWYPSMDAGPQAGPLPVIPAPEHSRHAYECFGTEQRGALWDCLNSYGPAWGAHGRFTLRAADVDALLAAGGTISQAAKWPAGAQ